MALVKQGDGLLIQGGALASGSGCCCGGEPCTGTCCVNGFLDEFKTTQAECEAACGTWFARAVTCSIPGYATEESCEECLTGEALRCVEVSAGGSSFTEPIFQVPATPSPTGPQCPNGYTLDYVANPGNPTQPTPICVSETPQCPDGYTLVNGVCQKPANCPPGFADIGQGKCKRETYVAACGLCPTDNTELLESACQSVPVSAGPCGQWAEICPPCSPPGCCCVGGQPAPEYQTQQSCTMCDTVYPCSLYVNVNCDYIQQDCVFADPDENGQCPEGYDQTWFGCQQCQPCPAGYTPDFFGGCSQCDPCPAGLTSDGFGGCSGSTYVADCSQCVGSCGSAVTLGPCGSWGSNCQDAGCFIKCCFCDGRPSTVIGFSDCLSRGGRPVDINESCPPNECCPPPQCDEDCEWPEQITLSISGMPAGYSYRFQNGGNGMPVPPGVGDDLVFRVVGTAAGLACTSVVSLIEDGEYTLDRVTASCNEVQYAGVYEGKSGGWCSGGGPSFETGTGPIVFSLGRTGKAGAYLEITSTGFGAGAHGVVSEINETTGEITGVTLCGGGNGYAKVSCGEVVTSTPTVTVMNGVGAEVTAEVDDDPESATFGKVVALTLVSGGSGYGVGGWGASLDAGGLTLLAGVSLDPVGGILCAGQDLSDSEVPTEAALGKKKCGLDLLQKSYELLFRATIFPNAVTAAGGIDYSLSGGNCNQLDVIGITCQVS